MKTGDMNCRWCPVREAPYVLREREDDLKLTADDLTKLTIDVMPIGTTREFKVGQNLSLGVKLFMDRWRKLWRCPAASACCIRLNKLHQDSAAHVLMSAHLHLAIADV